MLRAALFLLPVRLLAIIGAGLLLSAPRPAAADPVINQNCANTTFGSGTNEIVGYAQWNNCVQSAGASTVAFAGTYDGTAGVYGGIGLYGTNTNLGSLAIQGTGDNYGTLVNGGALVIAPGGYFTNWQNSAIDVIPGGALANNGTFINGVNLQTDSSDYTATVFTVGAAPLTNTGSFTNYKQVTASAVTNSGSFSNLGGNLTASTVQNIGSFVLGQDGITGYDGTFLAERYGSATVSGSFFNQGTVTLLPGTALTVGSYSQSSGTTTVRGGTKTVDQGTPAALSASKIVLTGGTLTGTGTISGSLTLGAGAVIAPGTVVAPAAQTSAVAAAVTGHTTRQGDGALTIDGPLYVDGGELDFTVDPTTGSSTLDVTGDAEFTGGIIHIDFADFNGCVTDSRLLDAADIIGLDRVQVEYDGLPPGYSASIESNGMFAIAVPAPPSAPLLLVGLLGLAAIRRRN